MNSAVDGKNCDGKNCDGKDCDSEDCDGNDCDVMFVKSLLSGTQPHRRR